MLPHITVTPDPIWDLVAIERRPVIGSEPDLID